MQNKDKYIYFFLFFSKSCLLESVIKYAAFFFLSFVQYCKKWKRVAVFPVTVVQELWNKTKVKCTHCH